MKKKFTFHFIIFLLLIIQGSIAQNYKSIEILPYMDDFESGFGEWWSENGIWDLGEPTSGPDTSFSGTNIMATVLNGNYPYGPDSRLISPKISLPSITENEEILLRFQQYINYAGSDQGYVQIQTYDSETKLWSDWTTLDTYKSYIPKWHHARVCLNEYANELVRIGFYHTDVTEDPDGIVHHYESSGWYIDDVEVHMQAKPFFRGFEDFEEGLNAWYSEDGIWQVGNPTSGPDSAYSGTQLVGTRLGGNYPWGPDSRLVSPRINLPSVKDGDEILLRFRQFYNYASSDRGDVQIKSYDTITDSWVWTTLDTYTSYVTSWHHARVDLTGYAGQMVVLGFYHTDITEDPDGIVNHYESSGWYIDDVQIDGLKHSSIKMENDLSVDWMNPSNKPLCGTGKEQPIVIKISNNGEQAVTNFEVGYSIDGGENFTNETVFKTIQPGGTIDHEFHRKADMADADSFKCVATVNIPYDIDHLNDTVNQTVMNERMVIELETTDTECNKSEGLASITSISGRPGPYEIFWTSGDEGMKAENLYSGVYFVTITDAIGCTWIKDVAINDLGAPEISLSQSSINDISCYGFIDGSISITPIQGTAPYSYQWSNGETTKDLNWLEKGQYDVTITDSDGCSKTHSFTINEPAELKARATSMDASCGELTGSASIQVKGGTAPYSYFWDSGHTTSSVTEIGGGIYNVTVKDNNWCFDSVKISINEIDAPTLVVSSIEPASCGSSDGAISITMADESYGYTYSWSDGTNTKDMANAQTGFYTVTVSFDDGTCATNEIIEIPEKSPDPGSICMITVDSITGGNIVIIDNPENPDALVSYNVYKLSKTGTYQYFDSNDPSTTNTTEDAASNMEITSYRYRVTLVDNCGNESEPSPFHETMHTVVAPDFSLTRANLFWNAYKGIDYGAFQIYRYSGLNGLEIIDTVPNVPDKNFYTYTDLNPPLNDTIFYVIAIELGAPCNSTKKAGTHNTVRSNKSKKLKFGEGTFTEDPGSIRQLNIFPNPNHGSFRVSMELISNQDVVLMIYDSQGRMIKNLKYYDLIGTHEEMVKLCMKPGLYYLQVVANDGITCKPFVVQ